MPNVQTYNISSEACNAWLESNRAAWCHRLSAVITLAACETNRAVSSKKNSDCRCDGCDNLYNQPEPGGSFLPCVVHPETAPPEDIETIPANEETDCLGEWQAEERETQKSAEHLNGFHHELLNLLEEELEEFEPDRKPEANQPINSRVPVFIGRCSHCKGYMVATREIRDGILDNAVYRCFNCGWRTSPGYLQNRMLAAAGKGDF